MVKNLILDPILASLAQIWASQNCFCKFYLWYQLETVPNCHPIHFKRKLMNQTSENSEKSNFGSNFIRNLGSQNFFREFFYKVLSIVPNYDCM